jgi:hypothetical protein
VPLDDVAALSKLNDSDQTIAYSDDDVRGRKVRDKDGHEVGSADDLLNRG